MASPSKPKQLWLEGMTQNESSKSSGMNSSSDATGPGALLARARASFLDNNEPQISSQHPAHSIVAPQAEVRPLTTPSTPPMMARNAGSASNTDTGESSSKREKSSHMPYEANAIAPATQREHSIYPVNSQLQKIPAHPEASIHPKMRPRDLEGNQKHEAWRLKGYLQAEKETRGLQREVWKEGQRLQAEKESRVNIPSKSTTATSENTKRPDRNADHQSDVEIIGDSADSESDFTMFDDTPRDRYLVEEKEEMVFSPWNVTEPNHTPSLSALSSMTEWDPQLDQAFQIDAEWNLSKWDDMRFKVPQTPTDIESLQQALEITRMDFWVRNPIEEYPDDLSQYGRESYGSQHRRLQHAFCRIWQTYYSEPPPELYRLPAWNFGFDECYWKPSSWGFDTRSTAYNQGLADMAAAKDEKGLQSLDLRHWKARLMEHVEAAMAHCETELALYAGPEKE